MKNLLNNWKTTSAGLTLIIGSVIHLIFAVRAGAATEGVWTASITAIFAGIGLMFAGDSTTSVTKEEVETSFVKKPDAPATTTTPPKT